MMKLHWQLFVAFFRIGIFGFGGGPSMIPLFKAEVVTRYGWMSDDEFGDVLAIGNTLPGPIATKMSGYIGYRVGGIAGCLNALIALVIPSVLLMVVFLVLLTQYKDQTWVAGMSQGVVPIVAVMMASLTWEFFHKGQASLGWLATVLLCVVSFVAIELLAIHPGLVIALLLVAALMRREKKPAVDKDNEEVSTR